MEFELEERLDETNREKLHELLGSGKLLKFDWEDKWLKGEEYLYVLANLNLYRQALKVSTFELKSHPDSIYTEPQSKWSSNYIISS